MTRGMRLRLAIAIALLVLLGQGIRGKELQPDRSFVYYSDCSDMGGLEWLYEGCWWRN